MKLFLFFLSILISQITHAQGSLSTGLVLYLPFNGNTLDISGNGHNATNFGGIPAAGISGLPNTAYYFNGSSYMRVKHHPQINNKSFSVCAKVKVQGFYTGFCYNNIILTKGLQRRPGFYSLQHSQTQVWDCGHEDVNKHNYRLDVQNISTPLSTMETIPYIVKDNWDCIVGTFDGDTAKMYVNGVLRFKYYEPMFSTNIDDLFIGKLDHTTYPFYFTGTIDEIRIYERALSASEVSDYCSLTTSTNIINANFSESDSSCFTKQFNDLTSVSTTGIKFWRWDFGDGSNSSLKNPSHTYPSSGIYSVKLVVIDSNGFADSITKNVSVGNYKFVKANNDTIICISSSGSKVQLFASGGATYSWSPTAGLDNPFVSNPIATMTASTSYVVTATDINGCVDKDTVNITLKPDSIKVVATPKNIIGCLGSKTKFSALGTNSFKWIPSTGLDNDTIPNPELSISGIKTYVVIGTNSNGCSSTDTVYVTAHPLPKLTINNDHISADCINKTVMLTVSGAEQYEWKPKIYCEKPFEATTIVKPPVTTVFTVKGINSFGCMSEDTVTVFVENNVVVRVPNAFTPNGDGINETIKPIIVCNFTLGEFSIYNRWGQRVYSTTSMNRGWDGTFEGIPCNLGVYHYMLKGKDGNNEDVLLKGDITLVR